jgi:hypothetical protein
VAAVSEQKPVAGADGERNRSLEELLAAGAAKEEARKARIDRKVAARERRKAAKRASSTNTESKQ